VTYAISDEDEEYRHARARHLAGLYVNPAAFAAVALFTGEPSDRALAGWVPFLWVDQRSASSPSP